MSRIKSKGYILEAIKSIDKAHNEITGELEKNKKVSESYSKEIRELQEKVIEMRNSAIVEELKYTSGKDVAERYSLSPGRISQIKKDYER